MSESNETAVARRHPFFSDLDPWKGWEPFRALFDPFAGDRPSATGLTVPKVDITESEDEYHVHAEIPGVSKDDVTVEFERGVLAIRGEKKSQHDEKTEKGHRRECSYGAFSRSISLPNDANAEQITAEFKNGVLDIAIKKSPDKKAKQIAVKG